MGENEELLHRNLSEISLDKALKLARDKDKLRAEVLELDPERRAALEEAALEVLKEHGEEINALGAKLLPGLLGSVLRTLRGGEGET